MPTAGEPSQNSAASAGTASSASISLTSNASPTATPASTSASWRPPATARTVSHNAATSSSIITPSIVSLRAVRTEAGSSASAAALARAAARPASGRTASASRGTARVPASASGSWSETRLQPNSLTLATCSHRSTGGLSIASAPPGSNTPNKKLWNEVAIVWTAAS